MREKCPDTLLASALPMSVLPTPGTSSSNACSPASRATMHSRITSGLPKTTWEMFCSSSPTRLNSSVAMHCPGTGFTTGLQASSVVYPSHRRFPRSRARQAANCPASDSADLWARRSSGQLKRPEITPILEDLRASSAEKGTNPGRFGRAAIGPKKPWGCRGQCGRVSHRFGSRLSRDSGHGISDRHGRSRVCAEPGPTGHHLHGLADRKSDRPISICTACCGRSSARAMTMPPKARCWWPIPRSSTAGPAACGLLERGVLAMMSLVDDVPRDWRAAWQLLDSEAAAHLDHLPWHRGYDSALPHSADRDDVLDAAARPARGAGGRGSRTGERAQHRRLSRTV